MARRAKPVCKWCGCAREDGSHPDNPRWHGYAGKYKTFHDFEPEETI